MLKPKLPARLLGLAALIYVVGLMPVPNLRPLYEQMPPLSRLLRLDPAAMAQVTNPRPTIKSIQRGTTTMGATASTNTTTITSVVLANSRLKYLSFQSLEAGDGGVDPSTLFCRLELTNATTISVFRHANDGTYTRKVGWEVIEYFPGVIRLVQRGYIAMGASTSATATITSVDMAKSELDYTGHTMAYASISNNVMVPRLSFTNATTITADVPNAAGAMNVGWQVTHWQF